MTYGRDAMTIRVSRRPNRRAPLASKRAAMGSSTLRDHLAFHAQWREWWLSPWRSRRSWSAVRTMLLLAMWQTANAAGFAAGWMSNLSYGGNPAAGGPSRG